MLVLIAINLGFINKKIERDTANEILKEFAIIPSLIEKIINDEDKCIEIAKDIYKAKDVFFLGRGVDYSLSMEGSLKLKEISYIHSEAYAAGELKHGTISLIEEGTNVVGLMSVNSLAPKLISNVKETLARGAKVTMIVTSDLSHLIDFDCHKIVIEKVHDMLQPILIVVPLQLIAFEVAKLKGCDIDKPRNLAKSVTVE